MEMCSSRERFGRELRTRGPKRMMKEEVKAEKRRVHNEAKAEARMKRIKELKEEELKFR
jgi:hypothetical protein